MGAGHYLAGAAFAMRLVTRSALRRTTQSDRMVASATLPQYRMVATARWSHAKRRSRKGAVVAWSPDPTAPRKRKGRSRGRLQEALAWPAAAGRMQPAQVLPADLTSQPGAELLADVGHRRPDERAGLLGAQPAKLQALDVPSAPAVHHRQQGGLGADPDRGPGLLGPGAQLDGEVGQKHQVPRCPVGMAGHKLVQHLAVRLANLLVQQGRGGDHQHAAGLGGDLGERLIEQDAEVAVGDPAGLELLAVGVGAKPPHLHRSSGSTFRAPGYPAAAAVPRLPRRGTSRTPTAAATSPKLREREAPYSPAEQGECCLQPPAVLST